MDGNVDTFVAITSSSADVARGFLEMAGGDFERAVALYFENPELASTIATSTNLPQTSTARSRSNAGRQDDDGVIHIDSDDDEDMAFDDDDDDEENNNNRRSAMQAAALAQEEEDAAMAKRLQEELYGGGGNGTGGAARGVGDDEVRAPIARTTETLVAPDGSYGMEDDGGASAILEQLRRRRPPPGRGPFAQSIWNDPSGPGTSSGTSSASRAHAQRLEDLFRPPHDLITQVSWDDARALGKEDQKWIMVNLQDMNDFNCQALNRDIWKDQAVVEIVSENFIFLQYDKDYPDAEEYIQFYFPNRGHENPDNYPHVGIVDPRTGEQVKTWSGRPFPSAAEFHSDLAEFLDRYSLEANSKNPVAKASVRKPQPVDVDRMTEDEMLEMALKNSMAASTGAAPGEPSRSASNPSIHDPDALTKASAASTAKEGEGEEEEEKKEAEASSAHSAWRQIAGDKPHSEPGNDPATTTRIQFRHPTGRVIRRFGLQEAVRRIYEWLKAEPLEGKEGIEFELKQMPAGKDLMGSLDQTIQETGLKQGTVMIEFIED